MIQLPIRMVEILVALDKVHMVFLIQLHILTKQNNKHFIWKKNSNWESIPASKRKINIFFSLTYSNW